VHFARKQIRRGVRTYGKRDWLEKIPGLGNEGGRRIGIHFEFDFQYLSLMRSFDCLSRSFDYQKLTPGVGLEKGGLNRGLDRLVNWIDLNGKSEG